ncbi:MAG: hypothetical protein J0H88_13900 [Sphingomonadales bacterium]|nr:hypothetical protein [Sphingomonadales bacterium]
MPITPIELYRRISDRVERQKSITLSAEELDMFVVMGGYDALSKYTNEWLRQLSEDRIAVTTTEHREAMDAAYNKRYPHPHLDPYIEAARRRSWELTQPRSGPRVK